MDPQTTSDHARKKRKVPPSASPSRNDEDATPDPPQKTLQFWFGDGNIILQTQTTQYRIHRGVLSFQSSMFENMFAMPQPEQSAQLSLQGCPVFPVTVSAEDWDALLGLLYNMERYIPNTHILPLETMLGMLRLGHKYDFARFKAQGLSQLAVIFSKDQYLRDRFDFFGDPIPEAEIIKGHEFKTLRTIEDLHIQSALPLAYLICISGRTLARGLVFT
ncbi:hypothetical protein D9619_000365 [Psilocybe cf. subviscida]|uniref:BTB domain-containing protein n=1 Tax=Psilocybe cf. subviscida TaxID=2480587 RepID=A0A8H5BDY4_9AGAR|nr:hypothetical protein D9619_000365 [Psilocybe cf. subviscida]